MGGEALVSVKEMSLLITRPHPACDETAARLKSYRVDDVLIDPMLSIDRVNNKLDKTTFNQAKGYIFSSVRVFDAIAERDVLDPQKPCLCVGAKTAAAAKGFGFAIPLLVAENGETLVRHIGDDKRVFDKMQGGAWLHVGGVHVRGDLAGDLTKMGLSCQHVAVYQASKATSLKEATIEALKAKKISHVLFYSERTITTFMSLIESLNGSGYLKTITAVVISESVATIAKAGPWANIITAEKATEDSMFKALGLIDGGNE